MLRVRYQILIIFVLIVIVYVNSIGNAFVMDDTSLVVYNPRVKSISNIPRMFLGSAFFDPLKTDESGGQFYRPMVSVVYAFLYQFGGQKPEIYHIFQIGLMGVNASLVLLLLRRFVNEKWAWWAASVFAIHPLNQMTVGYISQLNDGLYLLFGLAAMYVVTGEKISFKKTWLICGLLLFSLMSKESGILFMVAVFGYVAMFKKEVLFKMGYIWAYFLSLYIFLRLVLAKVTYVKIPDIPIMRAHLYERLMTLPKILWYYIQTFLWPEKLVVAQWWTVGSINLEDFWGPIIFLIIFGAIACWSGYIIRNKKLFIFWLGWWGIGMALHAQVWPLDWTVLDPWFGFSMIGLLAIIGLVAEEMKLEKLVGQILFGLGIVAIILLGWRTWERNKDWKNGITLFSHDLKYENNGYMQGAVGAELMTSRNYAEAIPHLKSALELNPWGTPNWFNLGMAYEGINDFVQARANYMKFISIMDTDFAFEKILLLDIKSDQVSSESSRLAEQAVEKYPNDYRLWLVTGMVKYRLGEKEAAMAAIVKSKEIRLTEDALYIEERIKTGRPVEIQYQEN